MTQSQDTPSLGNVQNIPADEQRAALRIRLPDRSGHVCLPIEALIPQDHLARHVWQWVTQEVDVPALEADLKATASRPGRTPFARQTLVALWLYATTQGVQSGREIERLQRESLPYLWLCGRDPINYHTLDDFRTAHADWLLEQSAGLVEAASGEGLADLQGEPMGQDGLRVGANAGSSSFRSQEYLNATGPEPATSSTEAGPASPESSSAAEIPLSARRRQARERARRERRERRAAARVEVEKVRQLKASRVSQARASTTDPEARVRKMGDGGFRPACNVQLATRLTSRMILRMTVTNVGTDSKEVGLMLEHIDTHHARKPSTLVADGDFGSEENIEAAARAGGTLVGPVKQAEKLLARGDNPFEAKPGDSEAVAAWRVRMGHKETQELYRQRGQCALPNAWCRNRGLGSLSVRGLEKVRAQMSWYVLAHNFQRLLSLRTAKLATTAEQRSS